MQSFNPVIYNMLGVASVAFLFACIGVLRGPGRSDRVIATDLLTNLLMGAPAASGVVADHPAVLAAAVLVSWMAFLATVAFAYARPKRA